MKNYSNTDFTLTEREQSFIKIFLSENGCGAQTPEELIDDNFSCQCGEDLEEIFGSLSRNQVGGFLSSLQEKQVIWKEERDGDFCKSSNRATQMNFEPNLYWVNDSYIESLPSELDFYENEALARELL